MAFIENRGISLILPPKESYRERPVVTPSEAIRRLAESHGLDPDSLRAPKDIILSLSVCVTRLLVERMGAKQVKWIYRARPFYVGRTDGMEVGIVWAAPGAPIATHVMEDLVACGAKHFIGVGLLASIQANVGVGDIVIPSSAIRDEGTSYHYLPREVPAAASKGMVQRLLNSSERLSIRVSVGPVWTTDAPYRETRSKIEHFRRLGVLGVDMETSAIFSLALYRRVAAANLLIVSGTLIEGGRRNAGFYHEALDKSIGKAIAIATALTPHRVPPSTALRS
jgi:uridine phosphorylase